MKKLRLVVPATLLALVAAPLSAQDAPVAPPAPAAAGAGAKTVDHAAFDAILKKHVRDERVDYKAVKRDDLAALDSYLKQLADVKVAGLPRNEQLAYYINLYNATMIRTIVDRLKPGYSPSENDFGVFKEPLVHTGGTTMSLNDLENKTIRPTFHEPRIHVALVCGARSCPPILPRAYRADDLEQVLEENMKRFVNDPFRNPIDVGARKLVLSHIFDWYAEDFGGKGAVAEYVAKYKPGDYSGLTPTFVDYSWELNITPDSKADAPAAGN